MDSEGADLPQGTDQGNPSPRDIVRACLIESATRRTITEDTSTSIEFFTGLLRTAQENGDVAADRDPVHEAHLLWSMTGSPQASAALDYHLDRLFRPRPKIAVVVVDCPDPRALAPFYEALLGVSRTRDGADHVRLALGGDQPELALHRTDRHVRPDWKSGEPAQQVHLDLLVADLDEAEREVLALGGLLLDGSDKPIGYRVYADPVGHPFCLVTPEGLG
ncbi:VOC family protein [Amycolatopsis speibonae]|uniref:VOC family protein n=1 Tax=Amycolatopsis speibonae TaxID=1450224 RepID=A0ABV7P2W8_9PSEU